MKVGRAAFPYSRQVTDGCLFLLRPNLRKGHVLLGVA